MNTTSILANQSVSQKNVKLEDIWPELEGGISKILLELNQGFPIKKWMALYTHVYDYCAASQSKAGPKVGVSKQQNQSGANYVGEELYNRLNVFLKKHMKELLEVADKKMDESLLGYYFTEWERYTSSMRYINHILNYLNRYWIKREIDDGKKEVYEVYVLSFVIWRDCLFTALKSRLTSALLDLIEGERNGYQVNTHLIRGVINGYVSLGLNREKPKETILQVYKSSFEELFLAATEQYYTSESVKFISENTVADYMKKVEARLNEEVKRVQQYLHQSTETELISRCEKVLIEKHVEVIWNEFQNLLESDKIADLTRMYALLSRIPRGLEPLRATLEKHVQTVGLQAVQSIGSVGATDPKLYVETLLQVFKKYNDLVTGAFRSDTGFVASLDKACRRFINENAVTIAAKSSSKSPELLARFTDFLLKKSPRNPEESEMDQLLNDVMIVFKYIEDKDVFQDFYSKMLAKRLIHGTSTSEDLEGVMIGKLKSTCGYEYTSKLQRMFTDMSLSRDLLERFHRHLEQDNQQVLLGGIDFSVLVLATGSWPLQPPATNFSIPKELQACEQLFQKFYQIQYSGRKLNWLHHLSKGELKTKYLSSNKSGYSLQCSTYQIGILLQFNTEEELTTDDIQDSTQLIDNVLKSTLTVLVKSKILVSEPELIEPEDIGKGMKFTLNKQFKNKKNKIIINVPVVQQVKEEIDTIHKTVEEDRKLQIQAAIVRIMKMRKQLSHSGLMSEVIVQLQQRFNPKVNIIKKCIDILIERDYLQRVEGQKDMYSYVA
ncbi:cullin A [Cavenderia fasciculata]|uniref:Cullin-1 n=1 Tax=Cavenderia fasciculata TaxID=261658 RepID=F4Q7P4_CACFS|nr:cullin A [Cavenderia fasciculata]EGG15794.1 cullin A [Cavenderia fasciculata]|eukprot:XP_004352119.1 cullin A [Cavenderia fasciculata]